MQRSKLEQSHHTKHLVVIFHLMAFMQINLSLKLSIHVDGKRVLVAASIFQSFFVSLSSSIIICPIEIVCWLLVESPCPSIGQLALCATFAHILRLYWPPIDSAISKLQFFILIGIEYCCVAVTIIYFTLCSIQSHLESKSIVDIMT